MNFLSRFPPPRLYAIIDVDLLASRSIDVVRFARELFAGGVRCFQYRSKSATASEMLEQVRVLSGSLPDDVLLFMNDRADICALAHLKGLHVGQEDVTPEGARCVIGRGCLLGVSTHNEAQIKIANETDVDYIAIGPVYATTSKTNPDPVIGLEGVRRARKLTSKPLVAIGGITRANARAVMDAGADSVAVISALVPNGENESAVELARNFIELFPEWN